MLSKEALWDALQEYPEAKSILIEKGRQLLRKDNLLDEEIAKRQDLEQMTIDHKVAAMEAQLDNTQTRLARLLADFNATQAKLKQRITKVENAISMSENASLYSPSHSIDGDNQMAERVSIGKTEETRPASRGSQVSLGDNLSPKMAKPGLKEKRHTSISSEPRMSLTVPIQIRPTSRKSQSSMDSGS